MDELDLVYKAFREYRNQVKGDASITSFKEDLKGKASVLEKLESVTTVCIIDEEWVNAIDEAMPYLIKAVMEERQFVKSEGETIPIDRIKSVSKDTVVDLAKHSNYISQKPKEGDTLIPDKLLMARKEADYAIYENRFLYTLLVYLTQFIELRLNQILALTGKYEAQTEIIKKNSNTKRSIDFHLTLNDKRFNDSALRRGSSQNEIDKIQSFLTQVRSLLMTPLMKEVSQKPKVSFPITKTNVLKFNPNFKNSLKLFEFLHSYNKKGFETKTVYKNLSPFVPSLSDKFSEIIYLSSFLTYILSNDFEKGLEKSYEENEAKKKKEEEDKLLKEVKKIQKNIKESNLSPEEYVQKFQKANNILEQRLLQKENEVEQIKQDLALMKANVDIEIARSKEEQKEIDEKEFANTKEELNNKNIELMSQIDDINKEKEIIVSDCANQVKSAQEKASEEISAIKEEMNKQIEENRSLKAEFNSMREIARMAPIKDFTSRDDFIELEEEKAAFERFFNRTWKETKKRIRKEVFSKVISEEGKRKKKGKVEENENQEG